jgi:hypothetical protein
MHVATRVAQRDRSVARVSLLDESRDARSGLRYEVHVDRRGTHWVVFQFPDCEHWLCWVIETAARYNPRNGVREQTIPGMLLAVVHGRLRCWKCRSDRWRKFWHKHLQFVEEDRDHALLEIYEPDGYPGA